MALPSSVCTRSHHEVLAQHAHTQVPQPQRRQRLRRTEHTDHPILKQPLQQTQHDPAAAHNTHAAQQVQTYQPRAHRDKPQEHLHREVHRGRGLRVTQPLRQQSLQQPQHQEEELQRQARRQQPQRPQIQHCKAQKDIDLEQETQQQQPAQPQQQGHVRARSAAAMSEPPHQQGTRAPKVIDRSLSRSYIDVTETAIIFVFILNSSWQGVVL